MARGAGRSQIWRSVIAQRAGLALIGVAIGMVAAGLPTRVLQNAVWGISTLDVTTFVAVGVLLIVIASAESFAPALPAVRVNPVNSPPE